MVDQQLTEEQIADFKESFSLFDKDGDGRINIKDLGLLVRSLNQNPTNKEIEDMIAECDLDNDLLDFPDFLSLMARKIKDVDPEEELIKAFQVFDKTSKGQMNINELKMLVSSMGEQLTQEETEQLLFEAEKFKLNENDFNYREFVKLITNSYLN